MSKDFQRSASVGPADNVSVGSNIGPEESLSQEIPYLHLSGRKRLRADEKIAQLEEFIKQIGIPEDSENDDAPDIWTSSQISIQDTSEHAVSKEINVPFFIGRTNPPHFGHIEALKKLIRNAYITRSKALILLGSGPAKERGGVKNPIDFKLKSSFITSKLISDLKAELTSESTSERINPEQYFVIKEMGSPAKDVTRFVMEQLNSVPDVETLTVTQIAGEKDDDSTKLDFVGKAVVNVATAEGINVNKSVVQADSIMSATQARNAVYDEYGDRIFSEETVMSRREAWKQKNMPIPDKYGTITYGDFYGEFADKIYGQIVGALKKSLQRGGKPTKKSKRTRKYKKTRNNKRNRKLSRRR
jgi:hypothetical protein